MTTVTPIIARSYARPTSTNTLQSTLAEHGAYAGGFIKNLALTLTGTTVVGIMGIGKSIAPDHTFFDRFSLVGIILGAITALFGAIGLYRGKKSAAAAADAAKPTQITITDPLPEQISDYLYKVSRDTHDKFKVSKDVVSGNAASTITNLRDNCCQLLTRWTDKQFGDVLRANEGRNEFLYENGNGTGSNITSTELKDRIAILIGYVVGSRTGTIAPALVTPPTAYPTGTDVPSTAILQGNLNLECIESGNSRWERLLPDEFTLLYSAARHYKINHMDHTDSITTDEVKVRIYPATTATTIDLTTTTTDLATGTAPAALKENVESVAKSRNYLRILQKGIEFVRQVEKKKKDGEKVSDSEQRDSDILRSALVAGLQLKVANLDDTLEQLRKIKDGDTNNPVAGLGTQEGLDIKTTKMDTYWARVEAAVRGNNASGITVRPTEPLKLPLFNLAGLITVL